MDISTTSIIQRIARVLAAHALSKNADGDLSHASAAIDDLWLDYTDAAYAVIKTLREPSNTMASAGDVAIWERMVLAALSEDP